MSFLQIKASLSQTLFTNFSFLIVQSLRRNCFREKLLVHYENEHKFYMQGRDQYN